MDVNALHQKLDEARKWIAAEFRVLLQTATNRDIVERDLRELQREQAVIDALKEELEKSSKG
jgi:hypothetical protein